MNPAPGFKKYPGHRVGTNPAHARVQVSFKGEVIADTRDAVELHESMSSSSVLAPVVYYVPRKDVKMERLARTAHSTHCPFKGDASYFSLVDGGVFATNPAMCAMSAISNAPTSSAIWRILAKSIVRE